MRLHFSTDDLAPHDRVRLWRDEFARYAHSFTPGEVADQAAFRARASGDAAGGFALIDVETSLESARRTPADVKRDSAESFFIRRFRRPSLWKAAPRSTPVDLMFEPGDFCVSASEWLFDEQSAGAAAFQLLVVPREALAPLVAGGRIPRPFRAPAASPVAALLGASLDAAGAQAPLLPDALVEAVLRNVCGLVALVCETSEEVVEPGRDKAKAALLAEVKRHIDRHLADPDLSPASVADAVGLSVRQLHRLFEPTGTSFARYVLRQRLIRCRESIAGATGTGRSVVDIAFGWGFCSMATFYRAFASEFGARPGALRASTDGGRS